MKQPQDKSPIAQQQDEKDRNIPEQKKGVHSPDAKDAAEDNIQESAYGHRSYASPDFFTKKPHL